MTDFFKWLRASGTCFIISHQRTIWRTISSRMHFAPKAFRVSGRFCRRSTFPGRGHFP